MCLPVRAPALPAIALKQNQQFQGHSRPHVQLLGVSHSSEDSHLLQDQQHRRLRLPSSYEQYRVYGPVAEVRSLTPTPSSIIAHGPGSSPRSESMQAERAPLAEAASSTPGTFPAPKDRQYPSCQVNGAARPGPNQETQAAHLQPAWHQVAAPCPQNRCCCQHCRAQRAFQLRHRGWLFPAHTLGHQGLQAWAAKVWGQFLLRDLRAQKIPCTPYSAQSRVQGQLVRHRGSPLSPVELEERPCLHLPLCSTSTMGSMPGFS